MPTPAPTEIAVNLSSAVNWIDLLSLAIPAAVTIIALFIGAGISRKAETENYNRKFLSEAFADVLARYSLWLDTHGSHEIAMVYAAVEKARLLCSPETDPLLHKLAVSVAERRSPSECAKTVTLLRKAMKAELQLPKDKKRRLRHDKRHPDGAQNQQHRAAD